MKVTVIGANGQLGWELIEQSQGLDIEVCCFDQPEIDITDSAQVMEFIADNRPSLVINAAAYTQVDGAETERELAFAVNRDGPAYLSEACASIHIPLIHISTDFVFNGEKRAPYQETDPVSPISIYGKSKAKGEEAVRSHLNQHIIIRTSWLYGVHGHNFVKTMLALGAKNTVLRVVADQYGAPTSAFDLAEAIWKITATLAQGQTIQWGTYHYSGRGVTTWHEFSETIFECAKNYQAFKVERIDPITSEEFPSAARRPVYSVLDCHRIEKFFGIKTKPWKESLSRIIDRVYQTG